MGKLLLWLGEVDIMLMSNLLFHFKYYNFLKNNVCRTAHERCRHVMKCKVQLKIVWKLCLEGLFRKLVYAIELIARSKMLSKMIRA